MSEVSKETLMKYMKPMLVGLTFKTDAPPEQNPNRPQLTYEDGAYRHTVSGFVAEIDGETMWVTAGHIINVINNIIKCKYFIKQCRLLDKWDENEKNKTSIPMEYDPGSTFAIDDNSGIIDIGIHLLNHNIVSQFKTCGGVVVGIGQADNSSYDYDQYAAIGLPTVTQKQNDRSFSISPTIINFGTSCKICSENNCAEILLCRIPEPMPEDHSPNALGDPDGMSGGLLVGLRNIGGMRWRMDALGMVYCEYKNNLKAISISSIGSIIRRKYLDVKNHN